MKCLTEAEMGGIANEMMEMEDKKARRDIICMWAWVIIYPYGRRFRLYITDEEEVFLVKNEEVFLVDLPVGRQYSGWREIEKNTKYNNTWCQWGPILGPLPPQEPVVYDDDYW